MGAQTTRRALFGAAAALPAIAALPAVARVGADAELLQLSVEWRRLEAESEAVLDQICELNLKALYPPKPEALRWQATDYFCGFDNRPGAFMDERAIARFKKALTVPWHMNEAALRRLTVRANEVIEADAQDSAARARVRRDCGWDALCERQATLADKQTLIEKRSMELRAVTPAGLAFKAFLVKRYNEFEQCDLLGNLTASLLADAIAAGAV